MQLFSSLLASALIAVGAPSIAHAAASSESPASAAAPGQPLEPPRTPSRDTRALRPAYHVQMLISDAVSLGLMAGGLACDSEHRALRETLFVYGALGYALGGPTIHVIHGEDKRAAGSFGIRLGAPVAVALATLPVAMVVARSGDSDASADPLTVGVIVLTAAAFSPLLAAAVDNLALARPHVEQPRPRWLPPRRSRPTLVLQPTFEVRRANAGLTLSGVW